MWTIDIDVGGTLTDGIFTEGDNVVCVKVDSTPHDLTVCLFDCLTQAATKLGFDGALQFLENVELIRWSTTITSNVLAECRGPRIGLLVSRGHERDLYGAAPRSLVLDRLLAEKDVIGIGEEAGETEVMNAARFLLESGARRICVSLKAADRNPERELWIKHVIDEQYPDHFLGSVPVLAGSDISKAADDSTRTYCAVINAYTHGALAATLFKAEDELQQTYRYSGSFLVSHINGGVAGVGKTKAIDTIESGPILGIHASCHMAKIYGVDDVVALDVGGTTAKVSALKGAEPIYRRPADFIGIPVGISLPYLRSIALGGGSVVKAKSGGQPAVELGPESMGSYPGPTCYGLGGDRPTLTDAFVAAGFINPEYFLGGTKPIDAQLACRTIEEFVARPLGISGEEACQVIILQAFDMVASLITSTQEYLGQNFSNHTLFAYGGNGGLFACGVAERIGLSKVQLFSFGPVFSAFGSSVSDISHVYERVLPTTALSEDGIKHIRRIVDEMKSESIQDMLGEGIRPDNVRYSIEVEVSSNGRRSVPVACPESVLGSAKKLHKTLAMALGSSKAQLHPEVIRLRAQTSMPRPRLVEHPLQSSDSSHAAVGTRRVLWGSHSGPVQVIRWELLKPGNCVAAPAVLESANTTSFVPQGWTMVMDRFGNGQARTVAQAASDDTY